MRGAGQIRASHVVVVGIGGVGSWAAESLARSGVGQLTLIDLDHVAESNINRQIHALEETVGQAKVLAMRDRIVQINPDCVVHCIEDFVEPTNWPALLPHRVDAVIDACDQVQAKTAMAAWARNTRALFVSVGAAAEAAGAPGGHCRSGQCDPRSFAGTTALSSAQAPWRAERRQETADLLRFQS